MNLSNVSDSFARLGRLGAAMALLFFACSALAGQEKILVCHVDAATGQVDLIVVPSTSSHLGNPAHDYEGLSDYPPDTVGASGAGTEDSDGNGVDDGCEPSVADCPCWAQLELQAIDAGNILQGYSCQAVDYPDSAALAENKYNGASFAANRAPANPSGVFCVTDGYNFQFDLTDAEAAACIEQIAVRCDELGRSVWP